MFSNKHFRPIPIAGQQIIRVEQNCKLKLEFSAGIWSTLFQVCISFT